MPIEIKILSSGDVTLWDIYVKSHPLGTLYHLSGWETVISETYGHKTYYLMAIKKKSKAQSSKLKGKGRGQLKPSSDLTPLNDRTDHRNSKEGRLGCWEAERIGSKKQRKVESQPRILRSTDNPQYTPAKPVGILPLVHLRHYLFGCHLVSIPFFDMGGVLADDNEIEKLLVDEAIRIAEEIKADTIELRNTNPISYLAHSSKLKAHNSKQKTEESNTFTVSNELSAKSYFFQIRTHKVLMLLDLQDSSDTLMKSFKSKLRSQIKKPLKEGLNSKIGGVDLLDDFYRVFSINMRDLGSPVHSKKFIQNVFDVFNEDARIIVVYKKDLPLACSLIVGFNGILENPWASALKKYNRFSPNMLLYWTMLEYACNNGYSCFDFGRSSPGAGTYKFKEQWGARPEPLYWYTIRTDGHPDDSEKLEKSKFENAIKYWKKLPVPVTTVLGPRIRKYISL